MASPQQHAALQMHASLPNLPEELILCVILRLGDLRPLSAAIHPLTVVWTLKQSEVVITEANSAGGNPLYRPSGPAQRSVLARHADDEAYRLPPTCMRVLIVSKGWSMSKTTAPVAAPQIHGRRSAAIDVCPTVSPGVRPTAP